MNPNINNQSQSSDQQTQEPLQEEVDNETPSWQTMFLIMSVFGVILHFLVMPILMFVAFAFYFHSKPSPNIQVLFSVIPHFGTALAYVGAIGLLLSLLRQCQALKISTKRSHRIYLEVLSIVSIAAIILTTVLVVSIVLSVNYSWFNAVYIFSILISAIVTWLIIQLLNSRIRQQDKRKTQ
jgi:hypothetical protein